MANELTVTFEDGAYVAVGNDAATIADICELELVRKTVAGNGRGPLAVAIPAGSLWVEAAKLHKAGYIVIVIGDLPNAK